MTMSDLNEIIKKLILRKKQGQKPITLLAVCPNSSAVLEAAINAAVKNRSIMLFAATLNQVDYEGSYTGWKQADFVHQMKGFADKYHWTGPLYPCLDHGGPWLKDLHTIANLSYLETMDRVKKSIVACIKAGYKLLHIDPTVDRTFPPNQPLPLELVVDRTVELISYAEQIRLAIGSPKLAYEVGTEEVHGGLVDINRFIDFINLLHQQLYIKKFNECWPCFFVAQIGTDLHTTVFNPEAAQRLYTILAPYGSMIKGHYTDWVDNPEDYPPNGMGAANVGPEFTAEEFIALNALEKQEKKLNQDNQLMPSHFIETLQTVVVESGRWKKWLLPGEIGLPFSKLSTPRKEWLIKTGSRYIWTNDRVVFARNKLYKNLAHKEDDPHGYVVDKITGAIEKYIKAFNLQNSVDILG
jgi:tagatose-1,6-bisphosphate aldolase non-catalytic subunit AgaZ/GatZ